MEPKRNLMRVKIYIKNDMARTQLEKRLIAAGALGFSIIIANGKRWIYHTPVPRLDFEKECQGAGIKVVCDEIPGGVFECLLVIDNALTVLGRPILFDYYRDHIEEQFDVLPCNKDRAHGFVNKVEVGEGGLF